MTDKKFESLILYVICEGDKVIDHTYETLPENILEIPKPYETFRRCMVINTLGLSGWEFRQLTTNPLSDGKIEHMFIFQREIK